MVFCQKKIFFIFLIERDPRKSVKLLYRESRGGRRWQSLACYRGKTKKKSQDIYNCVVLMLYMVCGQDRYKFHVGHIPWPL